MFQRNEESIKQRQQATQFFSDLAVLHQRMQALLTNLDNYLSEQKTKGQQYLADGLGLTKNRDSLAASVNKIDAILIDVRNAFQENNYSLPAKYQFTHNNAALIVSPDELIMRYAIEIERVTAVFTGYKTFIQYDSQTMKNTNSISSTSSNISINSIYKQLVNKQENSSSSSTEKSKLTNDAASTKSHRFGD